MTTRTLLVQTGSTLPPGGTWGSRYARTAIRGIAWSGSLYVAVGGLNVVYTSTDGINWTPSATNLSSSTEFTSIAYGSSKFVATTGSSMYYSTDGINWSSTLVSGTRQYVIWSGSIFLAVGGGTSFATSVDGVNWTTQATPSSSTFSSAVWTGTQFVVAGSGSTAPVMTSPDGTTWTVRTTGLVIAGLAWGNSIIVGVTNDGNIISSPDGITWTVRSSVIAGYSQRLSRVAWSGSKFIAVGGSGIDNFNSDSSVILTSPDGITWTQVSMAMPPYVYALKAVDASGPYIVAAGDGVILTSTDAATWTPLNNKTVAALTSLIWTGSQYVTLSNTGGAFTSPDGTTWTTRSTGVTTTLSGLVYTGSLIVAVGNGGKVLTSPDGITWTSRATGLGTSANLTAVAWSGSLLVAVGSGGTVITSPDGITWTIRTFGSTPNLYSVIWDGSRFLATGGASVYASNDAISWSTLYSTTGVLLSIAWSGTRYMAVGGTYSYTTYRTTGTFFSSLDGASWTQIYPSGSSNWTLVNNVTWIGNMFVICGSGSGASNATTPLLTSTDGLTLIQRSSGTTLPLTSAANSGSQIVAVGGAGLIIASPAPAISGF